MSDDEQLQIQKDTLWNIHLQDKLIACLEAKIVTHMDAVSAHRAAWDGGLLGATDGILVRRPPAPATTLPSYLSPDELVLTVTEWEAAKQKRERLKQSFDRM